RSHDELCTVSRESSPRTARLLHPDRGVLNAQSREGRKMRMVHLRVYAVAMCAAGLAACSRGANPSADSAGGTVVPPSSTAIDTGLAARAGPKTGILVATNEHVGRYLTDANGRALYMFTKDKKDSSTCVDACAKAWPPYTETQAATASDTSLDKTKFSTAKRADAQPHVSYNGRPLYLYQDDTAPGDMKGASKKEF